MSRSFKVKIFFKGLLFLSCLIINRCVEGLVVENRPESMFRLQRYVSKIIKD